jgi:LmbE family N-acetylglucosaminyl deacetylase
VQSLGNVLVVSPHPDDESLGAGGTASLLAEQGAKVAVVFITDGGASHPAHPVISGKELARMRRAEALGATSQLGIPGSLIDFIDVADGTLSTMPGAEERRALDALADVLRRRKPDTVMLPMRDDGTPDHDATFRLVQKALGESGARPRILEFPIWAWRRGSPLPKASLGHGCVWKAEIASVLPQKLAAVSRHESQVRAIPPDTSPLLSADVLSEFSVNEEFFFER